MVRDLAEKAKEIGFSVRCVGFDIPGDINGVYETMRVDFVLHSLHNVKLIHRKERVRASNTGLVLKSSLMLENRAAPCGWMECLVRLS
jgi:hypothetical protein